LKNWLLPDLKDWLLPELMLFAPEALRILAGGETTGTAQPLDTSPERATDHASSVALSGLGIDWRTVPVVSLALHHRLSPSVPPGQNLVALSPFQGWGLIGGRFRWFRLRFTTG
jgi:hypothetical protein